MTADQIRAMLQVLYHQGDAAVWDECWRDEDDHLIEKWEPMFTAMSPQNIETLKLLSRDMMRNSSQSPRWNNWVRPEGIDTLEKMGFYDSSLGDDACPSWTHDGVDLVVYVDLPVEFSEVQSGSPAYKQYILNHDSEPGDTILMTNDISEIEEYIKDQHCITLDGQHVCKVNPCACYCHH